MSDTETDPVLARRAQIAHWCDLAKRGGYTAVLIAMIVFVVGFVTEFRPVITTTIIACIVVSAVLLVPALIFGYGVKAAQREDEGRPFSY
ncbi:MAG: hypothetical protein U0Q22_10650 [Acidimicrobiales bacterium]